MGIVVKDEADKRLEGMREERRRIANSGRSDAAAEMAAREMEISRTAIKNPNPSKAYRLVNRDHKGRVGVLKGYGYKPVDPKDEAQLVAAEIVDGAQTHGDLILMETPIENYERRRASRRNYQDQVATQNIEASREKINEMARNAGLVGRHKEAVFDESRES